MCGIFNIQSCEIGNCECHFERVFPLLYGIPRDCETIRVIGRPYLIKEYSGCLRNPLTKYLGTNKVPLKPYDIIHYRMGDVANTGSGKTFSLETLYIMVRTMCQMSKRDIVILTEGEHKIPACEDRVVLAADLPMADNFKLFQHASIVGVGGSTFALAMMELAKPERIIAPKDWIQIYEFADCEKWSVIGYRGIVVHFDSKEYFKEAVLSGRDLSKRYYNSNAKLHTKVMNESVPSRRMDIKAWFSN